MFARLMAMGIPAASFFVAGVLAAQAASGPDSTAGHKDKKEKKAVIHGEADDGHKVVRLEVVKGGGGAKHVTIMTGKDGADAKIVIEKDGERRVIELAGLGEEVAEAVEEAVRAIEDIDIDVTVDLDEAQVAKLDKNRRVMRFEGKDGKVVILRSDDKNAKIEVKRGKDGKTIVIIEDGNVDVITPHRMHKHEGKEHHKEKTGKSGDPGP